MLFVLSAVNQCFANGQAGIACVGRKMVVYMEVFYLILRLQNKCFIDIFTLAFH